MTSLMSVLLPEPDTPVMQTITPSGISTSTLRKLFARAPRIDSVGPGGCRRMAGTSMRRLPARNEPVMEFGMQPQLIGRAFGDDSVRRAYLVPDRSR